MLKKTTLSVALSLLWSLSAGTIAAKEVAEPGSTVGEMSQVQTNATADDASEAAVTPPVTDNWEARWEARTKRYETLRKRALESGVMLPNRPPWEEHRGMMPEWISMEERMQRMEKLRDMSPEERDAYRNERYQEMRERAAAMGREMPETPPWKAREEARAAAEAEWKKHQEVIDGMTPEQQAACRAMKRRHMRGGRGGWGPMMHGPGMGRGNPQGFGPGPYGAINNFWSPDY